MQRGGGVSLDGERQDGRIRAEGLAGLISVPGTLHFENGELIWSAQGDTDRGRYVARDIGDGRVEFRSVHVIERGERIYWHGLREDEALTDVTAYWAREPGDAVHDALLADCVRLNFTPSTQ